MTAAGVAQLRGTAFGPLMTPAEREAHRAAVARQIALDTARRAQAPQQPLPLPVVA